MTADVPVHGGEQLRLQIAATRRRLEGHVHRVSTLAAPSRLAATGVEAIRAAVTNKALDTLHHVAAVASTTSRRPGVVSMVAAGAASAVLVAVRRRRARRARRTETLSPRMQSGPRVRGRSSWLGLLLSVATILLRRRL
jgi:hypothetical protein